jgi:coenzyme F420-dependent glucose-6-phosphate dehydrogenase
MPFVAASMGQFLSQTVIMASLGYHCSHEQYSPSELLFNVKHAFASGFNHAMCSDHFHPWSNTQGQSGFAWSWLGAALESTELDFGTVNAPGQRYHAAVVAQAAATLAQMYPGRFWIAVGSGEALNESITGEAWLPKPARMQRLRECIDCMRALWAGQTVNHRGLIHMHNARLYSLPQNPPLLIGACLSPETAASMGTWADGLITITQDRKQMQEIIAAFRENGGDGKPIYLQVVLSFAATHKEALSAAHVQWRQAALKQSMLADLASPEAFDDATKNLAPEDVAKHIRISADLNEHLDWLLQDAELGFDRLYLHNVHHDQRRFICHASETILPAFRNQFGSIFSPP